MNHNEYLRGLKDQYAVLRSGWASIPMVMRKTGVSRATVYNRLRGLERLGVEVKASVAQIGKTGPFARVYRVEKDFSKLFDMTDEQLVEVLGPAAKVGRPRAPAKKARAK
jgi:hypothetical protein